MNGWMIALRCPVHSGRLFGRVSVGGGARGLIHSPIAVRYEVACRDCRKDAVREGRNVGLVLHLFNGEGECVSTYEVEDVTRRRKTGGGAAGWHTGGVTPTAGAINGDPTGVDEEG